MRWTLIDSALRWACTQLIQPVSQSSVSSPAFPWTYTAQLIFMNSKRQIYSVSFSVLGYYLGNKICRTLMCMKPKRERERVIHWVNSKKTQNMKLQSCSCLNSNCAGSMLLEGFLKQRTDCMYLKFFTIRSYEGVCIILPYILCHNNFLWCFNGRW